MNHIAHTGSIASTDKKDTIDAIAFRGDTMARRSDLEMTKAQVQDSNRCPLNAFSQAAGGIRGFLVILQPRAFLRFVRRPCCQKLNPVFDSVFRKNKDDLIELRARAEPRTQRAARPRTDQSQAVSRRPSQG